MKSGKGNDVLYYLSSYFYDHVEYLSFLRLFQYLTFRAILASITAFVFSLFFGPPIIRLMKKHGIRDLAWDYGVVNVEGKTGTPTMGGLLMLASIISSVFLWGNLSNRFMQILVFAVIWFGLLGFTDDYLKMKYNSKAGLKEQYKYLGQIGFGLILGMIYLFPSISPVDPAYASKLYVPFHKTAILDAGYAYIAFITLTIVAISNSVNLADGLDGLAVVPAFLVAAVFGIFAYVIGNTVLAQHFLFPYLNGSGEIVVFCAAMLGAGVGFLWYNAYPAQIFMGDTGSLALGGLLGTISVLIKQEVLFILAGGIFVAEAFSVLVQKYIYIPLVGKRLFFRTPLHHTFQHRGIAETKVVVRFWIVAVILALISLSALKIR